MEQLHQDTVHRTVIFGHSKWDSHIRTQQMRVTLEHSRWESNIRTKYRGLLMITRWNVLITKVNTKTTRD